MKVLVRIYVWHRFIVFQSSFITSRVDVHLQRTRPRSVQECTSPSGLLELYTNLPIMLHEFPCCQVPIMGTPFFSHHEKLVLENFHIENQQFSPGQTPFRFDQKALLHFTELVCGPASRMKRWG